jgi:membrane-associated phospholipid phosphatase
LIDLQQWSARLDGTELIAVQGLAKFMIAARIDLPGTKVGEPRLEAQSSMANKSGRPSVWEALLWAVGLSVLFIVVYGGCNWITSRRIDVGVIRFEWEEKIPIIPWLIVPYMSIDLFFFASPFLCGSLSELRTHGKRLALATVVAGACFLVMPLQLADHRPEMSGWAGMIHDVLKAGDRPFNLFPSLHVTFLLLLWPLYHRHTHGITRVVVHAWFTLVLVSVLPVYQHHFIDMVGGTMLAVLCAYVVVDRQSAGESTVNAFARRPVIAIRYAAGAAAFLALSWLVGPRAWLFSAVALWIALTLGIMSAAYTLIGPRVYRKTGGRVPLTTRLVLWPHMLGLIVVRRFCFLRCEQYARIDGQLFLGRLLNDREASRMIDREKVVAALDLTAEHGEAKALRSLAYRNVPVLDLTPVLASHLDAAIAFIDDHIKQGGVYVHCGLGYSRSAAVAAAYLLHIGKASTVEEAYGIIRRARPGVLLDDATIQALRAYQTFAVPEVAALRG